MKFDDIFNEYKKISGKNETEIKKPWGLFALIIILMVTAAIFWLFTPYKWVGFLPYAIAFLPLFRIKKIMDQIDRTELENRQFGQMESFLAENHIYDKNAPLDFLCLDVLIQDGEKILPRYKHIDLGELLGVFSAFATGILGTIFNSFDFSGSETYERFRNICVMLLLCYSVVAFVGICFNRMLSDVINRKYYQIEKFINDLSDFKVKAIVNTHSDDHKTENNTPTK